MGFWARQIGFILIAYVVYTTIKGNLRGWLQILGLKPDTKQAEQMGLRGMQN